MDITCRDFFDQPYVQGRKYYEEIFKTNSFQERVTKIALTILLWTPFVNMGVHLVLKRFTSPPPLLKLAPHLSPISAKEKEPYLDHLTHQFMDEGTWDCLSREAHFGNNYERQALMKVNDREGTSSVFDLRKLEGRPVIETFIPHDVTYYCPFKITLFSDNRPYVSQLGSGWLSLSQKEERTHINRLDNFYSGVRLGSALVQFAIEMSLKAGHGGKVTVCSINASAGFYYRLGFICKDAELQKKVVEEYQNHKSTLDGQEMYLPPEAIAIWKQKIKKNSILSMS